MICSVRFLKIVHHGVYVLPVILLNVLGALAQSDSGWVLPKIQTSPSVTVFNLIKTDLDSSIHDGVSFVTAPAHFGWKESDRRRALHRGNGLAGFCGHLDEIVRTVA